MCLSFAAQNLVPIVLYPHLTAEESVDKDEVDGSKRHADSPPDEPDGESVSGAGSVVDGEAVLRLYGWQHLRVDGEGGGGHHARNVGAGGEETSCVALPKAEVPHEGEARDGEGGKYKAPRSLGEAGEHLGT